ncbi:MAG: Mur ligase family protein [Gemmatimonadota bacterium]
MTATYQSALEFLFPRTTQIKFGLDTTNRLLGALGEPQQFFPAVHIGGTNGKGSVSTLVAAALQASGLRVGLYTSPHLVSFCERIRVDGVPIPEAAVVGWTERMRASIEAFDATFFEASTAMAFAHFAAREVDIAVVEVGLGGRLDSTNVLRPLVSAVTHIALDHQKYLGESVEAIAAEKAGIAKPGVPFVIGERNPDLATVLREAGAAAVSGTPEGGAFAPVMVGPTLEWTGRLGLRGAHQRRNAAVAAAVLAALPDAFRPSLEATAAGFALARLPGRLDRRGKWLFDVAHNPDGMLALTGALQELKPPGPIHALVSILGDKAWPEMLVQLDQAIDVGILTVAPTADTRRWDLGWLERWLADPDRPRARAQWSLVPDFDEALRAAEAGAGTVLVTGSFHTVGDVFEALGFSTV